jgi:hypothetical protein
MRAIFIFLLLSYPRHLLTFVIFRESSLKFEIRNRRVGWSSRNSRLVDHAGFSSEQDASAFISALQAIQLSTSTKKRRNENISLRDKKHLNRDEYDMADISDSIERSRNQMLPLEKISSLCVSLGFLGISNLDFSANVWNVLENHIAAVTSVAELQSNYTSQSSEHYSVLGKNFATNENDVGNRNVDAAEGDEIILAMQRNRSYLDMLSGLVGMGVKWKSFSASNRDNIETALSHLLSQYTNAPKKSELFSLIMIIGNLNIPMKELKQINRLQLAESVVFAVNGLPTSKSISDLLFSMGNMGISFFDDFSFLQQQKLKTSISKHFSHNFHQNKFWKGLQGLAEIGIKWSNIDVNFR